MPLPIIGLPYQHILLYPTEVLACKCKEGQLFVLVITGFGSPVCCGHCGKAYSIKSINPDGTPEIVVELPQPGSRVM